jgi:hypothetical protein
LARGLPAARGLPSRCPPPEPESDRNDGPGRQACAAVRRRGSGDAPCARGAAPRQRWRPRPSLIVLSAAPIIIAGFPADIGTQPPRAEWRVAPDAGARGRPVCVWRAPGRAAPAQRAPPSDGTSGRSACRAATHQFNARVLWVVRCWRGWQAALWRWRRAGGMQPSSTRGGHQGAVGVACHH